MVKYFEGIEKQQGVQKKQITQGKFLYFVPDGDKYAFCSNDKQLQEWCESVKNKTVKGNAIKFVVEGAQKNLGSSSENIKPQSLNNKSSSIHKKIDPNTIGGWDTNIAQAFGLYCQRSGMKSPEFKTIGVLQEKGGQVVSLSMTMEDGTVFNGSGRDKQDAKRDVLEQYAQDVLGIDLKKNKGNDNGEKINIDDLYMHVNHETGETYYTYSKYDKEEQESLKRLQEKEKAEKENSQKIADLKEKAKQQKFADMDKQLSTAQIKKLNADDGRKYEVNLSDGTKYLLDVSYKDETKKKAYYKNDYDYQDGEPPAGYKETDVKTLTVKCDKFAGDGVDSFSMQASTPHINAKNTLALDLMFLSNLKMTAKNVEKDEIADNAHLLSKLLEVTEDQIFRSPKLLKQYQAGEKTSLQDKGRDK